MKKIKFLPVFFILFAIAFTSCDTEPVDSNLYDYVPVDNGGDDGGDDDGGGDNGGGTSSGDYWPMAVNNQWTYNNDGVEDDPMKIISTQTIDGNSYYKLNQLFSGGSSNGIGEATTYLRKNNGSYNLRMGVVIESAGITIEPYEYTIFKDNLEAGETWTQNVTQVTTFDMEGVPDITTVNHYTGTIMEKGISVEVEGHTYTNVIKSKMVMEVTLMGQTSVSTSYYWFAKDVGPVKVEHDFDESEGGDTSYTLLSYTLN